MAPAALAAAVRAALAAGGFNTYRLAVIVANAVSKAILNRGLAFASNTALTRGIAVLSGPVGWAISAVLTVPVFTAPAFRVTIPGTLYIARINPIDHFEAHPVGYHRTKLSPFVRRAPRGWICPNNGHTAF
jgi:uncharacterized protein YaaW (UPF0174 family)